MKHDDVLLIVLLLCSFCFISCSKDKTETETAASEHSAKLQTKALDKKGLDVQKIDINQDGRIDQWIYLKDGAVRYTQRDFNFDGIVDMTEFYENGRHVRDEIDLDYDGVVDLIITYENEKAVKKEYAVDFEGNRHGIQYFDALGVRTEIHRDANADGVIDTIEYYSADEDEPYKVEKTNPAQNNEN